MDLAWVHHIITNKDLSAHNKVINIWLTANKAKDWPDLPPHWCDVKLYHKDGKIYKGFLAEINKWGGEQYKIKGRYIDTEEIEKWEFI